MLNNITAEVLNEESLLKKKRKVPEDIKVSQGTRRTRWATKMNKISSRYFRQ